MVRQEKVFQNISGRNILETDHVENKGDGRWIEVS
jgi:hypothetical protein